MNGTDRDKAALALRRAAEMLDLRTRGREAKGVEGTHDL